jgi:hypothetical protein
MLTDNYVLEWAYSRLSQLLRKKDMGLYQDKIVFEDF